MVQEKETTGTSEAKIDTGGKRTINGPHEEEFYMNSSELAQFLRDLADQIDAGNELQITTDQWDMPFKFRSEEIEVEIDRDSDELEIEIEFDEFVGKKGLSAGS